MSKKDFFSDFGWGFKQGFEGTIDFVVDETGHLVKGGASVLGGGADEFLKGLGLDPKLVLIGGGVLLLIIVLKK
jgi:hypothetical protein